MKRLVVAFVVAAVGFAGVAHGKKARSTTTPTKPTATTEKTKCTYATLSPLDFVVAGARSATLWVMGSSRDCAKSLVDAHLLELTTTDKITASALASWLVEPTICSDASTCAAVQLALSDVGQVPEGTTEWHLSAPVGSLADDPTLAIRGIAVAAPTGLVVNYDTDDRAIDPQQDSEASVGDHGPIAVALSFDSDVFIANTAIVDVPASIADLPLKRKASATGEAMVARFAWRIASSTWGSSVRFNCTDAAKPPAGATLQQRRSAQYLSRDCGVNLRRIRFDVRRKLKTPLVVTFELVDTTGGTPVASFDLQLAAEAREESLPLPLWKVARVSCRRKPLGEAERVVSRENHGSMAISDDDLARGKCLLVFDYTHLDDATPLDVFGRQAYKVTVTRGAKKASFEMAIKPGKVARSIALPTPAGADGESGPYVVQVQIVGDLPGVAYREGSLPAVSTDDGQVSPETFAEFTLRPRGPHGFVAPFRIYVTFPLTPVSFRMPARASELATSSESPSFQPLLVRAGAMAVLEPWDYDDDRNWFHIPMSLQGGVSFFQLDKKLSNFSLMLGVSVDIPLIQKDVKESSFALGVFYEHDLHDWSHGPSDFVVTVGFDFLRLFKSNDKSEE